jgi:hypothetical protein
MPLPPPRKAGLRAGRQMQVESAKSRLRGPPRCFSPADQAGNPESGVATSKERHLATPMSW